MRLAVIFCAVGLAFSVHGAASHPTPWELCALPLVALADELEHPLAALEREILRDMDGPAYIGVYRAWEREAARMGFRRGLPPEAAESPQLAGDFLVGKLAIFGSPQKPDASDPAPVAGKIIAVNAERAPGDRLTISVTLRRSALVGPGERPKNELFFVDNAEELRWRTSPFHRHADARLNEAELSTLRALPPDVAPRRLGRAVNIIYDTEIDGDALTDLELHRVREHETALFVTGWSRLPSRAALDPEWGAKYLEGKLVSVQYPTAQREGGVVIARQAGRVLDAVGFRGEQGRPFYELTLLDRDNNLTLARVLLFELAYVYGGTEEGLAESDRRLAATIPVESREDFRAGLPTGALRPIWNNYLRGAQKAMDETGMYTYRPRSFHLNSPRVEETFVGKFVAGINLRGLHTATTVPFTKGIVGRVVGIYLSQSQTRRLTLIVLTTEGIRFAYFNTCGDQPLPLIVEG